ncbi:YciI family protein [Nocardiopsis sp. HNM0947]|uniref:YciI family protein n=1 Tax=Nocardiopsis coralli TaxID=2772213 RepID=A0ABR9P4V7_9ACTN|nr:YciI family protein [Nocardiopsis coralli]MBE2998861.1 YciI family protein [Nocardiopsis coralli]
MRYLMTIMSDPQDEAAGEYEAPPEVYEEMANYNEKMSRSGVLVTGEGLLSTSEGAEVAFRDGRAEVFDGPFTEAKEFIAGYWVLDVASKEEAIAWARRCPHPPQGELRLQLRRIAELDDLDEMPEELKERERQLRAQGQGI